MTYTPTPNFFLPGLDRVAKARHEIAHHFQQIINTLQQAEQGRKELMKATKKEFVKHLPQIAEQQTTLVEQAIQDCFITYEQEIIKRINDDIKSRQAELNNLIEQKQSQEINTGQEVKRLQNLDGDLVTQVSSIESVYQYIV